jgi:outer membrane protein
LFTGFKLSSLKSAAEYFTTVEKFNYEKEKINKAEAIYEAFWKYYITQQIESLVTENLSALSSHLDRTNKLLDNGLVTKNDLLKLKVEVANLELKLVDAKNNTHLAKAFFNKTLGLPLDNNTVVEVDDLVSSYHINDYLSLLSEAKINRQEIKSTEAQLNALHEKENAAFADHYPQLYAFGNFYYNNPNQRFMPIEEKFDDSWDVGVALKWDIWNWGGTSAKVEQAKQDFIQANNKFSLLKENIEMDVYNHYLNLKKSEKKIQLSDIQVESAQENYRITEQKYYQQLATSTDLIDAETSLLSAKTNLITSKVEYRINLVALEKSLGRKIYESE